MLLVSVRRVTHLPFPLPWEGNPEGHATKLSTQPHHLEHDCAGATTLLTAEFVIQTSLGGFSLGRFFFFNVSGTQEFVNLGQHAEAAAKRSWNELQSWTTHSSLHYFYSESHRLCLIRLIMRPCLMDYRIQWYQQAAILLWLYPWLHLVQAVAGTF